MKLRLATLCAAAVLLAACECGDSEELTTSSQGACEEAVSGPKPGSPEDFVSHVQDRGFFGFDKSDLSPDFRKVLENQAAWLVKYPEAKAEIAGYCDNRGTVEYNDKLGERRADAAKHYLATLGVAKDRLTTISYGKRVTLVPGNTEAEYAQNRTAITVIK